MPHRGPCVAKLTLKYHCQVGRRVFNNAMRRRRAFVESSVESWRGVRGAHVRCVVVDPARGHIMKVDGRPVFRSRNACCILAAALCAALYSPQSHAQRTGAPVPNKPQLGTLGEQVNANTIAIVSGNLNASYLTIAYDLSAVLDRGDEFRVLPVVGKGGAQNVKDVRFLKGVDLGLTQSLLLNYYKRNNEIGRIDDKIVYIAKLFNEEMHLLVRAESGITSIEQLAGKKVNFSDAGSNTQLA